MQALLRAVIAVLAAVVGFGTVALVQTSAASGDEVAATRQDSVTLMSEGDDDDDDDDTTGDDTPGDVTSVVSTFDSHTGVSNDATGSRVTALSRDRDLSVDDLTRDKTLDGGDPTIDHTQNHTNDHTKNDTR